YQALDIAQTRAIKRRDNALRQIARWRDGLGRKACALSDKFVAEVALAERYGVAHSRDVEIDNIAGEVMEAAPAFAPAGEAAEATPPLRAAKAAAPIASTDGGAQAASPVTSSGEAVAPADEAVNAAPPIASADGVAEAASPVASSNETAEAALAIA